jgi:uridine phosphorylase
MDNFQPSELILNEDSSIYHLKLLPEDIAETIIVVGDQNRVPLISKHFDKIEIIKSNREFTTHTGLIGKKRISVISTGIGVDNIDIVFNELDILASIDFKSRSLKKNKQKFNIIRLGTTGSLSNQIQLGEILFTKYAIGIDGIPYHYKFKDDLFENELSTKFSSATNWDSRLAKPYSAQCSNYLWDELYENKFKQGITLTMNGFYAPQGRSFRTTLSQPNLLENCKNIEYNKMKITNIEMETAGIYAFGKIFNHDVISINSVLANRFNGTFSSNPIKSIERMIMLTLPKIENLE